jgi:hypothetical protein
MKWLFKFGYKNKNKKLITTSIKQNGDNSNTIIGNVSDSFIGCTFNYDNIEPQWKDRLHTYITTLEQFKPQTALSLLEALEKSFATSKQQPSNELYSQILYQKGICNRFLENKDETCQCFISAYTKNKLNIQIKEQAALSYFRIENTTKANELAKELLSENEYNIVAWYISFLSVKTDDFSSIPEFVRQNIMFQNMLYNYFNVKKNFKCILLMKEFEMLPNITNYNHQDITIANFDENIFYSNVFFAEYLQNYYFTFHTLNEGNIEILKILEVLFGKILSKIEGSELEKKYGKLFLLNAYVKYILVKDLKYISEIRNYYLKLESKNDILALLCANVLQLSREIDFALEILNDSELEESNILFLRAFCYLKKNDKIQYKKAIQGWINSIDKIDKYVTDNYLASIFTLKDISETDELNLSDFIQNKNFENQQLKTLIETIVKSLIKQELDSYQLLDLNELASDIQQPKLLLYIADTYYYCRKYELAIDLYKKFVDRNIENRQLFFYIHSLYIAKKDSDELLTLLEKWRLNFSFQANLLRLEADLCVILHDWNRCLQICNTYLDKYNQDEAFLSLKLKCLDAINEDWCDNEIKLIAIFFKDYAFSIDQNILIVANILVSRGYFVEGIEILYKYSDKRNVRSAYLLAALIYSQKTQNRELLKEFYEITDGCFVKYESNGEINFFEMDKKNSDNLYDELLGHKLGDVISIKRMSSKDYSIRILRIMDKYLCLHDKIFEEAKQPLSGLPMESFNINSTDPEKMKQDFISLFGQQGEQEKLFRETAINSYYKGELSFTEVIIQAFRNEYLAGYTSLIYEHSGISIIPLSFYKSKIKLIDTTNYIIDFSSLSILYQIAKEHNITYPHKFLISRFIIDIIKQNLRTIQSEPKSELSIVVTNEEIIKYQIPENVHQNNIIYLEGLLEWIKENCEAVVSPRVIDFKRNIEDEKEDFIDYVLNTVLVFEDKRCILLTDDFVYFKFNLAQIQYSMSTEQYIKSILGDQHPALIEFIKNKYIGFTFSEKQLLDEFDKKIKSQNNYYTNCLENISMHCAPQCVKLVNKITQSQLDMNKQGIEIKKIFINMLKNGPLSNEIIQGFYKLLFLELNYSQEKLDFVVQCLKNVYQMLGKSIENLKK